MLNVIDNQWKDHLLSMDHLKEGIGLRGYGQKDPLIEYKKESFEMFQDMMDRIEDETIRYPVLPAHRDRRRRCAACRIRSRRTTTRTMTIAPKQRSRTGGRRRAARGRTIGPRSHAQHPAQERKGNGCAAVWRQAASSQRYDSRCPIRTRMSAATIRALAAAERNTRNATEPDRSGGNSSRLDLSAAPSSLLPENLGSYRKTGSETISPPTRRSFKNLALQSAESAEYSGPKGRGPSQPTR